MRILFVSLGLSSLLAGCSGTAPGQKPAAGANAPKAAAQAPAQKEDIHQIVGRLTSRSQTNQVTEGPGGVRVYKIEQGMGQVVVARTNSDGTVSAKCVESADDSRSFLGSAQ
jgi:hypothetical protein